MCAAAVGGHDPADPLRDPWRARRRRSGGDGSPATRRRSREAPPADTPARPAHARAGCADHRRRMGGGRRLGNAGLARHGDRHATRRAAGAPLVRRRPRRRNGDDPPELCAGGRQVDREGHQDAPDAPARARPDDRRSADRPPRPLPGGVPQCGHRCRPAGVPVLLPAGVRPPVQTRAASRTGTRGCAPSSESTATCTRSGTTRRPSCSPPESTCGPSPAGSAMAVVVRRRCGSTPRGSASRTVARPSCSAVVLERRTAGRPPRRRAVVVARSGDSRRARLRGAVDATVGLVRRRRTGWTDGVRCR